MAPPPWRIFTAGLSTETNTFAPIPTDRDAFTVHRPGQHPDSPTSLTSAPLVILRRLAAEGSEPIELFEGTVANAEPAGLVSRAVYESLRDEILDQMRAALPLGAVVLGLHGAMVAHGYDDVEGDILTRAREVVGPECILAAEFDPHMHLTQARFEVLDLLTIYKEFSHVDFVERATELISLTLRTLRGEIRPTLARHDCRMIERYPTSQEPMRSFVDRMMSLEFHSELSSMSNLPPDHPGGGDPSILSISAVHGFMPADVADVGSQMVVITDDDPDKAQSLATQLGAELFALRGRTRPQYLTAAEGVAAVEAAAAGGVDKPVVIADTGDNPGGGLPGDSTNLLRPLLASAKANRLGGLAVGSVCDPQAVQLCTAAGEGAQLQLRFGGKLHMAGGEPIDALVEVLAVDAHATQSFADATVRPRHL